MSNEKTFLIKKKSLNVTVYASIARVLNSMKMLIPRYNYIVHFQCLKKKKRLQKVKNGVSLRYLEEKKKQKV